ncbi:MAG: hypothetical protein ABI718_06835 [Acidobacteriota bacterium]
MNELHYDEETLLSFLENAERAPYRDDLEEHLESCGSCENLLGSIREFFQAMNDPGVWDSEEPELMEAEPDPVKLQQFLAHSYRLSEEEAKAEEIIPALLAKPATWWRTEIMKTPALRTAASIRKLADEAKCLLESSPKDALELATAISDAAEMIALDSYTSSTVFQLRGLCWKERANALRYLGRYREALKALDQADACYSHSAASHFDLAIVAYVRGTLLYEMERIPEALALSQMAADTFLMFGDTTRYTHARMLEGAIHFQKAEFAEARDVWTALLKGAREAEDLTTLASLFSNVGTCYVELGEFDTAGTYLLQSMLLYKDLGLEVARVRTQWALGQMLLKSGKIAEGLDRIGKSRSEFQFLGNSLDAGLAALDMVEACLASDRSAEAQSLCADLSEVFTAAGMTTNAMTAMAYLHEAVETNKATPRLVRHVRQFMEDFPQQPTRLFAPPPVP